MKKHFYSTPFPAFIAGICLLLSPYALFPQMVTTYAGNGAVSNTQMGVQATSTGFKNLNGIVADAAGNLYVCESDQYRIFKINPSGVISLFAGNGSFNYTGDGSPATSAAIGRPEKIAISNSGEIYFSSASNDCVRKINGSGIISTVAGTGVSGFSGDGGAATAAQLAGPMGLAFDAADNLYIMDVNNSRIRKVNVSTGIITTIAGTGTLGNSGNGGLATAAQINGVALAIDASDNIYLNNSGCLRKIDAVTQIISNVAGNALQQGYSGDGGPATAALLSESFDIAIDPAGNLYWPHWISDQVVRKINTSNIISTVAGTGIWGFSGDGGDPLYANFYGLNAITFDAAGNMYVCDSHNQRIRKIDFTATPLCAGPLSISKTLGANGAATFNHVLVAPAGTPTFDGTITGDPVNNPITAVTYTTASTYSMSFPGNGIYTIHATYRDTVSGQVCYRTADDTILISNSSTPLQFNRLFELSNLYICDGDSVQFADSSGIMFGLNNPAATYTITTNWGNGTITTNTVTATNQINVTSAYVSYPMPGVYTLQSILSGPGIANDTVISTVNTFVCGDVSGMVFNDVNSDCGFGFSDVLIENIPVTLTNSGGAYYIAWTGPTGQYGFGNIPAGTYTIEVMGATMGYTTSCTASMPHAITITGTPIYTENFAMNCNPGFDIATNGISLFNGFIPGQTDYILPHVGVVNADCNFVTSGQVMMVLTPCIQYVAGGGFTHPPDQIIPAATGDTLVWNVADINNIGTFGYYDYAIQVSTCTTAVVGDSACITMIVLPTAGDVDPSNNIFTRCFEIGVSYDPNYKAVVPQGIGAAGEIPASTQELTYTLHFQNTGTAPAMNIYLLDTISAQLDMSTIQILGASHSVQPYQLPNRTIKFMFANINLPDSTHNEPQSHGYVTYRIRPNTGLAPGTQIRNTCYIYFDYNVPVVTNTTLNTIETPVGIKTNSTKKEMLIYPNPAHEQITVRLAEPGAAEIVIYDLLGKEIMYTSSKAATVSIDMSNIKEGVYILKAQQGATSYTKKIVVSK